MAANRFREPRNREYMPNLEGKGAVRRGRTRLGFPNLRRTQQQAIHNSQRRMRARLRRQAAMESLLSKMKQVAGL